MNYPKFLPWIFLIAAYLIGSIPNGLIVSKLLHRKDIRKEGSGNIGATNALRAFGTVTGLFVLLLDVAKGYFPTLLAMSILGKDNSFVSIIALFVILGHMFPVYLKFKGGKGVATAAGVFFSHSTYQFINGYSCFFDCCCAFPLCFVSFNMCSYGFSYT